MRERSARCPIASVKSIKPEVGEIAAGPVILVCSAYDDRAKEPWPFGNVVSIDLLVTVHQEAERRALRDGHDMLRPDFLAGTRTGVVVV